MNSEKQLLATFERFKRALFDCDTSALRELIAEDYQGFDTKGHLQDKSMILRAYCPGGIELDRYDVENLGTRIIGEVGIITGTGDIHGVYAEHEFSDHVRFLDVYIHKDGHWRLYLSQVTPLGAA